jgi:hypothetical protein
LYPKKFDRVFNIIIDPDDFYVDESQTSDQSLQDLLDLGVLAQGPQGNNKNNNRYKHRDTSMSDVTLDEYFVTVEPYFYTPEYED